MKFEPTIKNRLSQIIQTATLALVCVLGLSLSPSAYAATVCISACVDTATGGASSTSLLSDASDGSLNVLTDTVLVLSPDNRFDFSNLTVASGASLSFSGINPEGVIYLRSQGDVSIFGTINAGQNSLVIATAGNLSVTGTLQAFPNISLIAAGTSNFSGSATVGDRVILPGSGQIVLQPGGDITLVQPTPVPLPAAVWLFMSALLGLAGVARRSRTEPNTSVGTVALA